jgi:succinate-semialdehyde dehydrogenase/glutarate-semialdehyde dehydrogenase
MSGIAAVNPATGERRTEYDTLDAAQVEELVARADSAARRWARTPLAERLAVVRRAGALLDRDGERYAALMTAEMGKLLTAARDEAAKCSSCLAWYAEHAPSMLASEPVDVEGERAWVAYEPLGVVLAVMPWNFPFWQVVRFAAPALSAGNVVLLKHASNVPECALALESLFRDAGAPDGVFQTLLVGSDAVAGLLADHRVKAATLTGSEGAGRSIGAEAGRQLKKTVLELGGSDPFVVMPSADLDRAVETAVRARTINNGQSCIAAKRFIVHASIAGEFERRFVEQVRALRVGDPTSPDTQVGPLVSRGAVEELHDQVQASVRAGARLLTGGEPIDGPGFFYRPTVLADAPPDSPAYRDETFGPVATLLVARDADDAIRIANDTKFGLGASVWTRDMGEAERFAREIEAGSVFVNQMVASDPRFPFGGIKASGYGRELSAIGMREFMNVKTVRVKLWAGGAGARTE